MNFVGIDCSHLDHKVHITSDRGKKVTDFITKNDFSGFNTLKQKLGVPDSVVIACESVQGPLVYFLKANGYDLYRINPCKIKRFKEITCVSGDKTDKIDARAISYYAKDHYKTMHSSDRSSIVIERLRALTSSYSRLTKERARYTNKLHSLFRQYLPLYDTLFKDISSKTQLKMVILFPTYESLSVQTDEELRKFLISNHVCSRKRIGTIIDKVRTYEQLIPSEISSALSIEAIVLSKILLEIQSSQSLLEKEMKTLLSSHYLGSIFMSIPSSGILIAAKLLAAFGDDKKRFKDANAAQCLMGSAPYNVQSGQYHKVRMRRACSKEARNTLYQLSFSSLRTCLWARVYYDKQRKIGKLHTVAIRALSNKWVKVIFSLWKNEIFYDKTLKIVPAA